ncbi:MAG: ABC transporter permease [Acidobacteriaceae bacterium]|nr:ABC transporter permease [Acidobacteriaceae bacterium]
MAWPAVDRFELFVASRYLRAKRKQAVISVITVISIAGVAAGVMALVIALAINNGFRTTLQRSLLGAFAHISIQSKEPLDGISNWRQLDPKLRKLPHVTSVSPGLYGTVLLVGPMQSAGANIKGVPLDQVPDILQRLKKGSFEDLRKTGGLPGIILGARLAENTGMLLRSVVKVLSPRGELTPLGMHYTPVPFRVVGIFESGFYDIDNGWAFTSLNSAQQLLGVQDLVSTIDIKLDDIYTAPQVARQAEKIAGSKLVANTWMEQFKQILTALNTERIVTFVTISLIQMVAALNILITLIMMVMEKNRDIALLMSMGARRDQIRRIFMAQGLLIGVVGTVIGLVLGYSISFLADRFHWLPLDQDVYSVSYVPFTPRWLDGIWIAATAILVSFIATIYPSRRATMIAPVESLRYE